MAKFRQTPVEPQYFDLKAASQYCGLSVRRLRQALNEPGGLPPYQTGGNGKILIKKSDLDQWLAKFRREPQDIAQLLEEVMVDLAGAKLRTRHGRTR